MRFTAWKFPRLVLLTLATVCVFRLSLQAAEKSAAYRLALESITSDDLTGHVQRLADKQMEGREAGTRGGRAAADYLTKEFTRLELRAAGTNGAYSQNFPPNYCNLLGMIPGGDPQLKDEVILVGAHYDHVGFGNRYNSFGPYGKIHPGADDNASGTAAVLELAQAFGALPEPPKRSILLAAWDAEEKGMLGSKYWTSHPTVPLEKIIACFNLDMIGHLRDDQVYVFGWRSGCGWRQLISRQNEELGLQLSFSWNFKQVADYYPFYEHGVPVLMFHTGLHEFYHRPSDTADLINGEGMNKVVRLLFGVVYELAESAEKIPYRKAAGRETPETEKSLLRQIALPTQRLGVILDPQPAPEGGVRLVRVISGSPAHKAGLKPGDRILHCAGREIRSNDELIGAVMSAENPLELMLQRQGEEKSAEVSLELLGRPLRLGITWRVDESEPGTIILTHVVPSSPAARADLQPGDRIYQINGHEISDETIFREMVKTLPEPLELLVDRDGHLRTVIIRFQQEVPSERAA